MLKRLFGFSNDKYIGEIAGFQKTNFEELKKYFETEELTKIQIGNTTQFINICKTVKQINMLFPVIDFKVFCDTISDNIRLLNKSMDNFKIFEIEQKYLSDNRAEKFDYFVLDYIRNDLISTYNELISCVLNVFKDQDGDNSWKLNNHCSHVPYDYWDPISKLRMVTKNLDNAVNRRYCNLESEVTFNSYKFLVGDLLKMAQIIFFCESLTGYSQKIHGIFNTCIFLAHIIINKLISESSIKMIANLLDKEIIRIKKTALLCIQKFGTAMQRMIVLFGSTDNKFSCLDAHDFPSFLYNKLIKKFPFFHFSVSVIITFKSPNDHTDDEFYCLSTNNYSSFNATILPYDAGGDRFLSYIIVYFKDFSPETMSNNCHDELFFNNCNKIPTELLGVYCHHKHRIDCAFSDKCRRSDWTSGFEYIQFSDDCKSWVSMYSNIKYRQYNCSLCG